jgi:uncharacterized protein (TIGR02466 family)
MVTLESMFAVPMGMAVHPHADAVNPRLRELFLRMEQAGDRFRNTYAAIPAPPGLFESQFTLFENEDPVLTDLRRFFVAALGQFIGLLNGYAAEELNRIEVQSHTWFHITRYGGYFPTHNHPMASWSGVYCVSPGAEHPDYPDSGVLRFHNPMALANMFIDPANVRVRAPYHTGNHDVRFRAGQLLLFPSWLIHEVLPFYGHDERITVAFNAWFKRREG